ncbi:MAG TPA: sodium:solute symporter family protein [Candidatus Polarisedimenticolaceae bacterium]|nr:sodium:solute symporter family protein [Candidatus Polarisedimenticolaceae bacterium]
MSGSLGALDLAVVGGYLAATFVLGVRASRRARSDEEDFLLAGRALTLPAFVVTLVATWYGGVLGVGEYSYAHGLSNWLVLGVPYYIGTLLFALFFAERARSVGEATLPDLLFSSYGKTAGLAGAVVVLALSLPAPYLLMLGVLLHRAVGIPQPAAVVLCALFCLLYIGARGFRSVVQTKGLQFALMFGGFLMLLPIAVARLGGLSALRATLPATMFEPLGGARPGYVIAWYFIALQTLVEPTFFQRCFAARTPRVARRGLLVSILFFALFDGLTTFTGMYAHALLPALPSGVDAFPALGESLLPAGLLGVFYAGMIATVMSTVDAFLFNTGLTLSRDLVARVGVPSAGTTRGERIGLIAGTLVATAVALGSSSVVGLWYGFGSVGTAALLPPLIGALFPALRPDARFAAAGTVIAAALTIAWLTSTLRPEGPWLSVEPIYPGLAAGFAIMAAGIAVRRRGSRMRT